MAAKPHMFSQRRTSALSTTGELNCDDDLGTLGARPPVSLLECEEARASLPNLSSSHPKIHGDEIIAPVLDFFTDVCPLYPIICNDTIYEMASGASIQGLQQNIQSCVVLFTIALEKAYSPLAGTNQGLAEFQKAIQLSAQLGVQFTLEYVQVQVLSALFMLRKTRVLDFWQYLHTGCNALYTLINQ